MFPSSTQKKHWFFQSKDEVDALRQQANERFIKRYCQDDEQAVASNFLSADEEHQLCRLVEETAQKFCQSFSPPFLPTVIYTGFVFFKRFYMHNSVMEHLAKNIMMSCLYLASKVDEFNISIDDFIRNLKSGTPQSNATVILSLEAPIMRHLHYHLIVHSPYRPLEGHFIEMKTSCPAIPKVESMRPGCEDFLWRSLLTDACFYFTPTQIALAALVHSGELLNYDISRQYILGVMCGGDVAKAETLLGKLRDCITMVTSVQTTSKDTATYLQSRAQEYMGLLDQMNAQRAKRKSDGDRMDDAKRVKNTSTESTEEGSESDDDDD